VRVSAAVPPTGVVTFLFTDIEGSTRRWEADADAMRSALMEHDEVLRTTIEAHDGFLFSHTGDGVVAAFASPKSATNAAVAAQRALELPVRMGLATGEAELRDGDYFGTVLNRAARVMAAGHGGQILLADSTASLVSGVDLLDLGPRRLRDVPMAVGMFQVRAEDLCVNFPPLRALDTTPGNLRPATTSFIGRESDVSDVAAAVRAHRLITLTGVGGVGKTRLALEAAAQLADEFPDGVWVFELAAVTDPAAVPDAVAAVLGITQQPGRTVRESVAAALEGRVRLLVIDNCEHVLDAAADLIEAILEQSATVRVLATSREVLGIAQEQVRLVRSLGSAAGIEADAVRLFVERAQDIAPGFSMADGDEAAAVTEICQRLDGIPLAIELAASRMASMTLVEVRDRLDQRFRLLVGSRRGVARHQTLRHAVAWSYEHLDETEKVLLERCSVFAGGFDLQSACGVAGLEDDADDFTVLDTLDALVRKSLLVADRSSERTRYSMLETIRQFAEEQLITRGVAEEVRAAHARCFAGREADTLALWDSPQQRESYNWFNRELANLRTAFRWAADHEDLDTAAPIAICTTLLGIMVEIYEPFPWVEELIEPARAVAHPRLAALYLMAAQSWLIGRVKDAVRNSEAGQVVFASGRYEVPLGFESWFASVYTATGQPERALRWEREELARGRDIHGLARLSLVASLVMASSRDDAMGVADGAIAAAAATRNPWARSFALLTYGMAYCDANPVRARDALRDALLIAQDSGNRYIESHAANVLGRLEARHGEPLAALDYLVLAIRNYHDSGNISVIQIPLGSLATLLHRLGHHESAATIAGFASGRLTDAWIPELNKALFDLRDILGEPVLETFTRKGKAMTTAAMAIYAYDQIDVARTELRVLSK
jgi:predicted ATPase/class 3 adenylate cyclase